MDSRRLFKLVTRRWWLITIVAIAGAAAGYLLTQRQNAAIEDSFEARAPVLILQTHSESEAAYETRLRSLESSARLGLSEQISGSTNLGIDANLGLKRLEFKARAPSTFEATDLAEALRDDYEAAEPAGDTIGQAQEELARLAVEIRTLRGERAQLTAGTPIDPGVAAELALMEAQLSSLRQQAAALNLGIIVPGLGTAPDELGEPRPVEEVRADLAEVRLVILQLEGEYEELKAANPTAVPASDEENLDLLVLEQKIRDAESVYISTSLLIEELLGGSSATLFNTETAVVDVTKSASSPQRAALLGLLLGGALAIGAVVGTDRLRRPVLGIEDDLALPVLAIVDPVRPGAFEDRAWYPSADDVRRSDVQALRAALEGATSRGTTSIVLTGVSVAESAVQELAADLATSIAAADRKVLLVDACFEKPSRLPEFGASGPTLAEILSRQPTADDAWNELKELLDAHDEVVPQLLALRAGELDGDPVDAVAGRRFRELLEVAREFVEIIVVAAPEWGDRSTGVLTQRLENFVLVGRLGAVPAQDVADAANELAGRRAAALGLVLLRRRRPVREAVRQQQVRRRRSRIRPEPESVLAASPAVPDEPIGLDEPVPTTPTTTDEATDETTTSRHGGVVTAEVEPVGDAQAPDAIPGEEEMAATVTGGLTSPTGAEAKRPEHRVEEAIPTATDVPPFEPAATTPVAEPASPDDGPTRPEIVTPLKARRARESVDHISELHIAEEGDIIDTVARPSSSAASDVSPSADKPTSDVVDPLGDVSQPAVAQPVMGVPPVPEPELTLQDRIEKIKNTSSPVAPPSRPAEPDELIAAAPPQVAEQAAVVPDPAVDELDHEALPSASDLTERPSKPRKLSLVTWTRRAKKARQDQRVESAEPGRSRRWVAPLESGEIFLIEQLSELLRHGIDRPRLYGHPSGALLMYPSELADSAAAMLYNAAFKDAPERSEELEDSIASVLAVEPDQARQQGSAETIDWYFRTLGLEVDSQRQEQLVSALDTWLTQRLMTALAALRIGDLAWYLSSPGRTFELIVDGQSFNSAQVLSLRAGAVARYLERLRLSLWRGSKDSPDAAAIVGDALADVEEFDAALHQLGELHQIKPFTRRQLERAGVLKQDASARP